MKKLTLITAHIRVCIIVWGFWLDMVLTVRESRVTFEA
jgi:hypothetical protein